MKSIARIVVLLLCVAACAAAEADERTVTEREGQRLVTHFRNSDPEMQAAMVRARESLKEFEKRLAQPPAAQTRISLKGRFEEDGHVEHMWVEDVVVTPQGYRGRLGNQPLEIQSIDAGDQVLVPRDRVSDWFAVDDGKLVGSYTLRLARSRLPVDKRAAFDASVEFEIED